MATPNISHPEPSHSGHRLPISADYLAIAIGLRWSRWSASACCTRSASRQRTSPPRRP